MREPTLSLVAGSSFQFSILSKPLLPHHSLNCATLMCKCPNMCLRRAKCGVSDVGDVHNENGRR